MGGYLVLCHRIPKLQPSIKKCMHYLFKRYSCIFTRTYIILFYKINFSRKKVWKIGQWSGQLWRVGLWVVSGSHGHWSARCILSWPAGRATKEAGPCPARGQQRHRKSGTHLSDLYLGAQSKRADDNDDVRSHGTKQLSVISNYRYKNVTKSL